jgi:hypothetical protein
MSEVSDKPKQRWTTYLAVGLVLLLIVYPLSTGPVLVIAVQIDNEPLLQAVTVFYMPLVIFAEAVPAIK